MAPFCDLVLVYQILVKSSDLVPGGGGFQIGAWIVLQVLIIAFFLANFVKSSRLVPPSPVALRVTIFASQWISDAPDSTHFVLF